MAVDVNTIAIGRHPDWKDAYLNLAHTYEEMGESDKAEEYRQKAALMR